MNSKLILSTRKGLIIYSNKSGSWKFESCHFIGIPVSLFYRDPNNNRWWACLDHGHWGCKLHYSDNEGSNWLEVDAPKYPEDAHIKVGEPAVTKYLWAVGSSHQNGQSKLYIGTEPGGLFESNDNGENLTLVEGLWKHPTRESQWFGGGRDHAGIHSILTEPENPDQIYVGISVAGVFKSEDGGKSWIPKNKGLKADFLPDPDSEVGQDPHLLTWCENHRNVMWQQNHCGIFRSVDHGENWTDISEEEGPAKFGFAIQADENNPEVAWVVPAISDEIRVAVGQSLCVSRTDNGGKTWTSYRKGLPQEASFDITFRHALTKKKDMLAFGTTTGNLYLSNDGGESWNSINNNLPLIYAAEFI